MSEEYDDKSDDQLQLVVHHPQWYSGVKEVSLSIPLQLLVSLVSNTRTN